MEQEIHKAEGVLVQNELEFAQIHGLCFLHSHQKISQLKKKKAVSLSFMRLVCLFIPLPKRIHGKSGSVYAS